MSPAKNLTKIRECSGCEWHGMGYVEFHEDAERRHKKGERQVQCPRCGRWVRKEHLLRPAGTEKEGE